MNTLFNKQLIKKYIDTIQLTEKQKDAINYWNKELINGHLVGEEKNYGPFENIFLIEILGYDFKENILRHDKEKTGSGRSEFKLKFDDVFMIIELKGSNINLDKSRNDKNETPVDQIFRYARKNEGVEWLFLSNYDEFRLYNYHKPGKYISWTMNELSQKEDKLKEFILILGKESFKENLIDTIYNDTLVIEKEFNDEFYQLYSETRLMLIHDLEVQSDIDRLTAIHYAQLIMDRIIFICFSEDKKLLHENLLPEQILEKTLLNPIKEGDVKKHRLFDRLCELFEDIHEGNPIKNIPQYNGGLFEENLGFLNIQDTIANPQKYYENCIHDWNFEEETHEIEEQLSKAKESINPIYKNILVMASFDFESDVDVNILGHIFESSIGDIEKLKENNSETRHKFGIHYTPHEITEYICKNTIIPYLSKSNNITEIPELLSEYSMDLDELDTKLKTIKILDPACGSGSMLNKAVDLLLEIHQAIFNKKYENDSSLDKWWDGELVRRDIILNNIYGVDLNEESVEITKLGLFLKICKKDKKLPSLDKNIKCGNSLVDDKTIAGDKAFNWRDNFPEVFENGGFDIIIGNPPYIRVQEIEYKLIDYLTNNYKFAYNKLDMSILFIELSYNILKENGIIGIITSNMFLTSEYGREVRKFLLSDLRTIKIIDFGDLKVFPDALTYVSIFIFKKELPTDFKYVYLNEMTNNFNHLEFNEIKLSSLDISSFNLKNHFLNIIFDKINKFPKLNEIGGKCNYGIKTGLDNIFLFDKDDKINLEKELLLKWVVANDCNRFSISQASKYVLYPYKINNGKMKLISIDDLEKNYPLTFSYITSNKEELSKRKDSRKKVNPDQWYKLIRPGNIDVFNMEKIIFPSLNKKHKFCFGKIGEGYSGGSVFSITTTNSNISLKYLLCIFNSKLIETYLQSITPLKKGNYHSYSSKIIDNVPIPQINLEKQQKFIELCDKIIAKNEELNNEISSFHTRLKIKFKIDKLSNKLKKFYELSFEEFLTQLEDNNINILKSEIYEILNEEYTKTMKKICPLKHEISELEDIINQNVFELYGLNNDEIKIIYEF